MADGEVVFDIRVNIGGEGRDGAEAARKKKEPEETHEERERRWRDEEAERAFVKFQKMVDREEAEARLAELKSQVGRQADELKRLRGIVGQHNEVIGRASQFLQNPAGAVGGQVLQMLGRLGPWGAAAAAAITAIAAGPEATQRLVRQLGQKGGPLNRDWRRTISEEVNGALDLRQQKDRQLGLDPFIVTSQGAFRPVDGTDVYNSLYLRGEVRQNKMSQDEQTGGLY